MKKILFIIFFISTSFFGHTQTSNYDLFIKKGLDYYSKGLQQQAMVEFQNAHTIDSTRVEAYYYTGVTIASICQKSGNSCEGAIEMLTTSININPDYRNSYYNRGVCFLRLNMFKDAIKDFNEAIKLNPENKDCYLNRALAKIYFGQKEEGCEDIKKALDLNSIEAKDLYNQYCK